MDNLFWRGVLPPGLKGSYDFVHPDPPLFCFPPQATVSPSTSLKGHVYPLLSPLRDRLQSIGIFAQFPPSYRTHSHEEVTNVSR